IIRRLSNRYYNPANALVVPSDKLRKTEQGYKVSCPITVIPTGIELDRFSRRISHEEKEQLLAKYGLTPGKTLVSVCRLAAEKNLDEIVSYMPALLRADPEVMLLIVGDGPHRSELEKHVREAGVEKNVVFAGMIDRYDVYKYYQTGDIFVCASTSESQGLTYVEALSSGLPLVCRRDDCLVGVLDNGKNGYQYETETEFVRGVMHILDDRELAHNMQLHSLENAEGFGAETFGRRMEQLYLDVLSGEIY
ncbi:MAG: glycosyltransferase, partial [Christensenellales bacterium]